MWKRLKAFFLSTDVPIVDPRDASPAEPLPHSSHETRARGLNCPECNKVGHLRVYYYDQTGRLIQCQDCGYYWVSGRQ